MADTSQQELTEPHTNGVMDGLTEEEKFKMRPADIDADMREMERRKRVVEMMSSKTFMAELERILEAHRDGSGSVGLLQQISDMMGAQGARFNSNVFKNSNCVVPINDIRGGEVMGYMAGEKQLRCKLAAVFRLLDLYGWTQGVGGQISARLSQDHEHFLVNPYGLLYHEITASSLVKVDMQGEVVDQGTTNFGIHLAEFQLHSTIHAARPDITCIIHITTPTVTAVSSLKSGLLPIGRESIVIGDVSSHHFIGDAVEPEEREKITRNLGPINKVMLLTNRGALCCGETIEEAFYNVYNTVLACETQLKLMPMGIENLSLISEETKKAIFEASRKSPAPPISIITDPPALAKKLEKRWRIGGTEFEALMRMLDNAGFRTGYSYRNKLIKSEPPRARNEFEIPPTVSSLGYSLTEAELYKDALLKGGRKGNDRKLWLTTPNVYQKVEVLETGTPDPKKITKWVSDGSPTHSSTPVKIDSALQFVPKNTNPKEFKQLQQQIKDYRRAEKISAGPQSHILEGVTWDEAKKLQDATVSGTGEQVVLVGAASKGIIQRGFQHNAMVYKTPYAKNPFDAVTDQDIDQYKKEIERKTKGDIYDESQSESEALSSFNISRSTAKSPIQSPMSVTSETEEESRDEPRVLRIETRKVPAPSHPDVVLSDADATTVFLNEMRRTAIEPRNDRNRRDYMINCVETNNEVEEEVKRWWHSPIYEETKLEVARSVTITKYQKPQIIEIKSTNINFSKVTKQNIIMPQFKKPKPYIIARRNFFCQLYSKPVLQRINNLPIDNNIKSNETSKQLSHWNSPVIKQGFVRNIVNQFISSNLRTSDEGEQRDIPRKRIYEDYDTFPQEKSPIIRPLPKIQRLNIRNVDIAELESPGLVGALMNSQNQEIVTSREDSPTNDDSLGLKVLGKSPNATFTIEKIDIIPDELKISSSSDQTTTTHSSDQITVRANLSNSENTPKNEEKNLSEVILIESDDEGNENELDEDNNTQEDAKNLSADENGNSLSPKIEKEGKLIDSIVEFKDEPNFENLSSIEASCHNSFEEIEFIPKNNNSSFFNNSINPLESSFNKDLSDSQPWRYSSPIPKNYQREDSMTEVINSMNINLTPSKVEFPNRLRETDFSIEYNLDPSQMNLFYSLTSTEEAAEDESKKEYSKKPNCSDCSPVSESKNSGSSGNCEYFWDEEAQMKNSSMKKIDMNEVIDLFDNSIVSGTDMDLISSSSSVDNDKISLGESTDGCDLLEISHSTFVELQQSNDTTFHNEIVTSANKIIAGLGERETIVTAENIVQEVLADVQLMNLTIQADVNLPIDKFKIVVEAKISALQIAKKVVEDVVEDVSVNMKDEGSQIVPENIGDIRVQHVFVKEEDQIVSDIPPNSIDGKDEIIYDIPDDFFDENVKDFIADEKDGIIQDINTNYSEETVQDILTAKKEEENSDIPTNCFDETIKYPSADEEDEIIPDIPSNFSHETVEDFVASEEDEIIQDIHMNYSEETSQEILTTEKDETIQDTISTQFLEKSQCDEDDEKIENPTDIENVIEFTEICDDKRIVVIDTNYSQEIVQDNFTTKNGEENSDIPTNCFDETVQYFSADEEDEIIPDNFFDETVKDFVSSEEDEKIQDIHTNYSEETSQNILTTEEDETIQENSTQSLEKSQCDEDDEKIKNPADIEDVIEHIEICDDMGLIVIDELVHHVIDKSEIVGVHPEIRSSTESLNQKKLKENTNAELKGKQSEQKEEHQTGSPAQSSSSRSKKKSKKVTKKGKKKHSDFPKCAENLINEAKLIFSDMDDILQNESDIKADLENIVSSCCSNEVPETFSNDTEAFQYYSEKLVLIAKNSEPSILELSNIENKSYISDESNDSSGFENCSESVKQFISRFKAIEKSTSIQSHEEETEISPEGEKNESKISEESVEEIFSPPFMEANSSLDFPVENSFDHEICEHTSSGECDTKSDNSKEKIESQKVTFCLINYETETKNNDDHDSIENLTDDIESENMIHIWELNELNEERSFNEIRGNDYISTFIQYEKVDDIWPPSNFPIGIFPSLNNNSDKELETISEDEELLSSTENDFEVLVKRESLTPITEIDESFESNNIEQINEEIKLEGIDENEIASRVDSTTEDYISCNEEKLTSYETGENSVAKTLSPESWYSMHANGDDGTYTVQSNKSDDEQDVISRGNHSPDTFRKSIDINSVYDALKKLESSKKLTDDFLVENSEKKCIVCQKLIIYEEEMEYIVPDMISSSSDVCSNCMMSFSLETREFIRMERLISDEPNGEKFFNDNESQLELDIPKYEDTTLYALVKKLNLTDTLNTNSSSIEEVSDFSETICSIRMLYN